MPDLDSRVETLARELRRFCRTRWPSPDSRLPSDRTLASDPHLEEGLRQLLERWKTPQANVVFAGEVSSGKSSLIDAVIGDKDLLPVDSKACTATWAEIHFDREFRATATVRTEDGDVMTQVARADLDMYLTVEGAKKLKKTFGQGAAVKGVSIGVRSPELSGGLHLYDTPGAGGLKDAHLDAARAGLTYADAVVYLFRPGKPPSVTERQFLAEASRRVASVILVCSYRDTVANVDDVARAAACLQDRLEWERILGDELEAARMVQRFHAGPLSVSAKNWTTALSMLEGPDRDSLRSASRLEDLFRRLRDVSDGVEHLHQENLVGYCSLLSRDIAGQASHLLGLLHGDEAAEAEQQRREENIRKWTENNGDRWRNGFDAACKGLRDDFKELARKESAKLSARYRTEFENMSKAELAAAVETIGDKPEQLLAEMLQLAGSKLQSDLADLGRLLDADLGGVFQQLIDFGEVTEALLEIECAKVETPLDLIDVSYAAAGLASGAILTTALTGGTVVAAALPFMWPCLLGAAVFGGRSWYLKRKGRHVREAGEYLKLIQTQLRGELKGEVVAVANERAGRATATLQTQIEGRLAQLANQIKADRAGTAASRLWSTDPEQATRFETALSRILTEASQHAAAAQALEEELRSFDGQEEAGEAG